METAQQDQTGPVKRRISALDALRGFALSGIVFINIPQTMGMMADAGRVPDGVRLFVLGRFYPIFYILFGIGFGLFFQSAARRGGSPLVPMVRRLVALGVLGAAHHLLQPGEVLLPFALAGLVVLLPVSFLRPRVTLVVGGVLTLAGVLVGVGGFGILPGLFVLGFALAQIGVAGVVERSAGVLGAVLGGCIVLAAGSYLVAVAVPDGLAGRWFGLLFSLTMAVGYAAVFLLLLRTAAGPALSAVFAPLGRMALTNYITATLLFVALGPLLGLRGSDDWGTVGLLGAGIILTQAAWSALWLRRFDYGPLEWAWRTVTYWRRIPLRREAVAA